MYQQLTARRLLQHLLLVQYLAHLLSARSGQARTMSPRALAQLQPQLQDDIIIAVMYVMYRPCWARSRHTLFLQEFCQVDDATSGDGGMDAAECTDSFRLRSVKVLHSTACTSITHV